MKLKRCTKCKKRKPATVKFFDYRTKQHLSLSSWCKDCSHARTLAWRERNREYQRNRMRYYHQQVKLEALTYYSGGRTPRCECCGETILAFLGIDHLNGGGHRHRIQLRKENIVGGGIYRWLKKQGWPEGYRVLCHCCNIAIGIYGFCPHKQSVEALTPDILRGRSISLAPKGEDHPSAILNETIVIKARAMVRAGKQITVVARKFGVPHQTMRAAVIGKNWSHVAGAITYRIRGTTHP